jgi:beta-lactamase superfamily II metal-dependent hydrolase
VDLNRKSENEGDDPLMRIWRTGIRHIHHLFITHPHKDHITGIKELQKSFSIGQFYFSGIQFRPDPIYDDWEVYEWMKQNFQNKHQVGGGWYTTVGDVRIDYLLPPKDLLSGTSEDVNNNSLLLRFAYSTASGHPVHEDAAT